MIQLTKKQAAQLVRYWKSLEMIPKGTYTRASVMRYLNFIDQIVGHNNTLPKVQGTLIMDSAKKARKSKRKGISA